MCKPVFQNSEESLIFYEQLGNFIFLGAGEAIREQSTFLVSLMFLFRNKDN